MNSQTKELKLPKWVSWPGGTTAIAVFGIVAGAGIYAIPSLVAAELRSPSLLMTVWLLAGAMTTIAVFSFVQITRGLPRANAMYSLLEACFGPYICFLFGWSTLILARPALVAALALIFSSYLAVFLPLSAAGLKVLGLGVVLWGSIMAYLGKVTLPRSAMFALNAIRLVTLLALVGAGIFLTSGSEAWSSINLSPTWDWSFFCSLGAASGLVLWTYEGWSDVFLAHRQANAAHRELARGLLIGSGIMVVIFLLVNAAFLNVLAVSGMAASSQVASDAMKWVMGPIMGSIIAVLVLLSVGEVVVSAMSAGPRNAWAMARENLFPAWAQGMDEKYRTPGSLISLQAFISMALLLYWDLQELVIVYVLAALPFSALVVGASLMRKRVEPLSNRLGRIALNGSKAIYLVFVAGVVVAGICTQLSTCREILLVMVLGTVVYGFWQRKRKPD